MNANINNTLAKKLSDLYGSDDSFKRIVLWFYDRKKDSWEMPVRIAAYRTGLDEREVRRVFKLLDELECGRFIKGRGEHAESRMAWKLSIRSIASAAKGETADIEEVEAAPEDTLEAEEVKGMPMSPGDGMTHVFKLRPDFEVVMKLPSDFSEGEAERLSRFLRAVPII